MEEIIKKFIYTSVGLVSQTTTKIREMIDELIRDRKITEEEGKRIVDDFTTKTKSQSKDFEEQLKTFSTKFRNDISSTAEEEIKSLKEKIRALEDKISQSNQAGEEANPDETQRISMENDRLQQKKELFRQKLNDQSDLADKISNNEQVNLNDEVLTPEKKIEAEQERMKNQSDRPSAQRSEKDSQQSNLSGPILTPGKKMDQDSEENKG